MPMTARPFLQYVLAIYFHLLRVFSVCGEELNHHGTCADTSRVCEFLKAGGNNWFTFISSFLLPCFHLGVLFTSEAANWSSTCMKLRQNKVHIYAKTTAIILPTNLVFRKASYALTKGLKEVPLRLRHHEICLLYFTLLFGLLQFLLSLSKLRAYYSKLHKII